MEELNLSAESTKIDSERPAYDLRMSVAKEFLHAERIYFPHSIDFRGRAYPIPPHLNHQGPDLCRGLLEFAEKKPLGERGLFWLKITLANLKGEDKLVFEDRIKWCDAN